MRQPTLIKVENIIFTFVSTTEGQLIDHYVLDKDLYKILRWGY